MLDQEKVLSSPNKGTGLIEIIPINEPIDTVVSIPGSKSITHRVLITSALAQGRSIISNPLVSEDTLSTLTALQMMDVKILRGQDKITVYGTAGELVAPKEKIYLNDSGTSLRLLTSVASLADGRSILTGSKRLCERPITELISSLSKLGVTFSFLRKHGFAPFEVRSKLLGGRTTLDCSKSSQFLSSLLLSAPFAEKNIEIDVISSLVSSPYVELTKKVMMDFGIYVDQSNDNKYFISNDKIYRGREYKIESDFSSASYFFAATAILGGKVSIENINQKSKQADKYILDCLKNMGCEVQYSNNSVRLTKDPEVSLHGINVDLNGSPDIVQTLSIVACFATTPSTFSGIAHLKYKETDRITALTQELNKIGVKISATKNSLRVFPLKNVRKGKKIVETYNDHRMAMSFAILGLKIPGIVIKNPQCVNKSFPGFFNTLEQLREGA